jgi:hypothetical protein
MLKPSKIIESASSLIRGLRNSLDDRKRSLLGELISEAKIVLDQVFRTDRIILGTWRHFEPNRFGLHEASVEVDQILGCQVCAYSFRQTRYTAVSLNALEGGR